MDLDPRFVRYETRIEERTFRVGEQATSATFAAASTNGTERKALSSQIYRYARAAWVGATSTSQFALSLVRY